MTPEQDLLEALRADIAAGDVVVRRPDDAFVAVIQERYPFSGSQIDWSRVPGAVVRHEDPTASELFFGEAERFLDGIVQSEGIGADQQVVVLGDSAMAFALVTTLGVLARWLADVLALPQHTYVMAPDGSWCFVFTMEGDLCFGHPPAAEV